MFENLLIHVVSVLRPNSSKGTSGGANPIYTTVYEDIACRVQTMSESWLVQYAQKGVNVSHSVYFNAPLTLEDGDLIYFGSRRFEYKGSRDPQEDGRLFIIDALELR